MKNKYLLTSFVPMLVTAGLLITAPIIRNAFYQTVEPETTTTSPETKPAVNTNGTVSNFIIQIECNSVLFYTGNQVVHQYKSGTFITARH